MRFLDKYGLQRLWNRITAVFQPKITATGVLKGTGSGNVTAASGTDLPSHNHNASNINAGTLTVNRGGTGANTFTSGALLKGNGTGAIANGPTIDGNETTKFLRHDGSWQVPAGTYSHPTKTAVAAAAKKVGNDGLGHVVLGAALTASDVGAAASSHNHNVENLTNFGTRVYDAAASRTKNTVLAAPNGSAGAATFRALVAADIPNISAAKITSGTLSTDVLPTIPAGKLPSDITASAVSINISSGLVPGSSIRKVTIGAVGITAYDADGRFLGMKTWEGIIGI